MVWWALAAGFLNGLAIWAKARNEEPEEEEEEEEE